MTLDEAIQEFEFDCKIRHLSPKTIDNYTSSSVPSSKSGTGTVSFVDYV